MRFWDSSALLPLFVRESDTRRLEDLIRTDDAVAVWMLTRLELFSALARRGRQDAASAPRLLAARGEIIEAWPRWVEIAAIEPVRQHAERLVETHPLRAADALQVGAALVAASGDPASLEFVTLDQRQAEAASREGFRVLG